MSIFSRVPDGMNRRHFMSHMAGAAALAGPATAFTNSLMANVTDLKKRHKSAILLWMGGGPSTMDLWDLKPARRPEARLSQSQRVLTEWKSVSICR